MTIDVTSRTRRTGRIRSPRS